MELKIEFKFDLKFQAENLNCNATTEIFISTRVKSIANRLKVIAREVTSDEIKSFGRRIKRFVGEKSEFAKLFIARKGLLKLVFDRGLGEKRSNSPGACRMSYEYRCFSSNRMIHSMYPIHSFDIYPTTNCILISA